MIGILFRDIRQFLRGWTWIIVTLFHAQIYVMEFALPVNPWVSCAALGPLLTATGVLFLELPGAIQDKSQGIIELWRQSGRSMLAYVYAKCVAPIGWATALTILNGLVLCLWSKPSVDDTMRYAIGLLLTALTIVCGTAFGEFGILMSNDPDNNATLIVMVSILVPLCVCLCYDFGIIPLFIAIMLFVAIMVVLCSAIHWLERSRYANTLHVISPHIESLL